ncbi:hypothetical protein C6502_07900 [Candidatus Poribacteria bacterium]|nr:MAG: hypothetical protein C6502_07900 [Candidatus Poribacteria bacterium]
MKWIGDSLEKINDRLNPIVVKELRQAVQGKFLVVVIICFLCVQLLTMGLFLVIDKSVAESFDGGLKIFRVLVSNLLMTCLLCIPAYTGIRLANERADANVDLLFITTLRPQSIIWGKFLAGLVITVLLYSACMPFMTFTYLLRGIDLPSIFVLLTFDFLVVAVGIQSAIFVACIPANRVFRVILGVGWFVIVLIAVNIITVFSLLLMEFGIGSQLDAAEFWLGALGVLVSGLALIGIFALLSIALISPLSANRALPVRILVTVVWFLTGIGAAIWSIVIDDFDPIWVWAILHILLHSIGLFVAVSEREHLGWRVRQAVPRRWFARSMAFLFYSGAAGGVMWSASIIALTVLSAVGWLIVFPHMVTNDEMLRIAPLAVLGLYTFSYVLAASLIRRNFLMDRVTSNYTWVIALVLLGITTTIIPLILFFIYGKWDENWLVASPLGPFLFHDSEVVPFSLIISIFCAVFIGALSLPWFFRQFNAFRPPREKVASGSQTDKSGNVLGV